jgi:MFS family permease
MSANANRYQSWAALLVLSTGLCMPLLDLTIVNIAIPSIVYTLHTSLDQILWTLNAYSLGYAVLLITSGRLGDVIGPRNVFVAALGCSWLRLRLAASRRIRTSWSQRGRSRAWVQH